MSVYPLGVHGTWGSDAKDHQARSEARHHDSKNWESNQALDIAVPLGTPVYAVEAGKIGDSIGFLPGAKSDSKLEGQRLHLITGKNEYYYAHLSKIAPDIAPGMTVKQGELLGYSGKAGG